MVQAANIIAAVASKVPTIFIEDCIGISVMHHMAWSPALPGTVD